ncbi:HNH endonuclease signature motif containing protein [Cryobacterium sp. Y11]|uniref:HNH endonuclease signature motif containing protein n=1 Tax=Cryobacterium sp. Y11 TaxID=2045016 RepID=UPI000CE2EEB9|nr:HNH endonuclease signature motif containing protein [Cryobacterium sp. Y11]
MSLNGNTPQQGFADSFDGEPLDGVEVVARRFDGEPDYWSLSAEDLADCDAFHLKCLVTWQIEAEIEAKAVADAAREAAAEAWRPSFADGPAIPADLELAEVFAAIPPGVLFADVDPDDCDPADVDLKAFNPDEADTSMYRRRQALLVDRVVYFENLIAWAQAGKAETLAAAWNYTSSTAETGRPQAGPGREHDWDSTFAAQQGLVAEMACALRIPYGTASGLIHESWTLVEHRPNTLDALRSGEISLRHARRLLDQLDSVPKAAQTALEEVLLPHAKKLTAAQFDGKARKIRERFHPDSITVRRAKCLTDRKVMFYPDNDGMATLWMRAASDDVTAVYNRITDTAISLQGPDEPRTLNQLRADVAIDLLASGVTDTGLGAGISATVNVTVPVLTLMGTSNEPGELEGYGPIDAETARKLAGTATSFLRILTHPHTGIVLDVSATPFRVPAALKKYLQLRDGTCRFPGCNRSARNCDLDHTRDKQFGGPTTATNLHFLCPANHNLKHFSAWTATAEPDGTMKWTSPAGKHYATDPAIRISPHLQQTTPPAPAAAPENDPGNDPWTSVWNITGSNPQPF